jgi:hypothetical protein
MKLATTLVHKGAMPIAVHAISSFAKNFTGQGYRLEIHTDGSPDENDEAKLLECAKGVEAVIVRLSYREERLNERLRNYPKTATLIGRRGYFTKLELPMYLDAPYFYFDSDIVWLRGVDYLAPPGGCNAFSTETWSWYHGVCEDVKWIANNTPRRVNSGFYYVSRDFPFEKMEKMLEDGMFNPEAPYNTDQEIMAYLYPDMMHYHIDDFKRSRVGVLYDLNRESCAALHFPGGMWKDHLDQICALASRDIQPPARMRFTNAEALSSWELFRMRKSISLAKLRILKAPIDSFRKLRKILSAR